MLKLEIDPHSQVMTILPDGPLSGENSRAVSDLADRQLRRAGGLRGLLLQASHFPGWRDCAALFGQIRCLREHREGIGRVAVLTESPAADFLGGLAEHFTGAELRVFGMHERRRADVWVAGDAEDSPAMPSAAPAAVAAEEPAVEPVGEIELDDAELSEPDETDSWFTH